MDSLPPLPPRPLDGHKGTFGTACIVGGQAAEIRGNHGASVMIGGPAFSALAALRSGCGLAMLAMPRPILAAGLTIAPSATGLALPVNKQGTLNPSECAAVLDDQRSRIDCLALGPGLGEGLEQQQIIARLISRDDLPLVIDADGLNALTHLPDFQNDLHADAILTPHPGEFRRLARSLEIDIDITDPNLRSRGAEALAQRLGCIVVLKGRHTVITDGQHTHLNHTGNPALATAGTGDILTGIIAGLIAQHYAKETPPEETPPESNHLSLLDCARLATHLHGLAADLWARQQGMGSGNSGGLLAMDLLDQIPRAMQSLR